ncbi:UvrD-helicase domain-containing protein [Paraclostridium bifermentans]|uniref:UvrD-helicase domain-containing protein n=1 Tax=Paraclostridium bifermentans TaxID=1490 RepID=UPI002FE6E41E
MYRNTKRTLDRSYFKYVIIDEAQDYTTFQYEIFYQLFKSANMTILGNINQSINPFINVEILVLDLLFLLL